MVFFILILLILIFNRAEFAPQNRFTQGYMAKDKTTSIKGIFVALILLSHGSQYMALGGAYDEPYIALQSHLGQMVVAMFLFYSGYGMMERIKRTGYKYVKSIVTKRFPNVLLNFDIAIVLYLILGLFLGKSFDLKTILLSFIGWESVGNSNWYMFAIFVLYLLTFAAFFGTKWTNRKYFKALCVGFLTVLTGAMILIEMKLGLPSYWYNTLILFVMGFYYSCLEKYINRFLLKNDTTYFLTLLLSVGAYVVFYTIKDRYGIVSYTLWALAFTAFVIVLTMKVSVNNAVLNWMGQHVFSIYILQRIPMSILNHIGLAASHKYIFLILSIAATLFMAQVFDSYTAKLSGLIWKKRRSEEK